MKQSENRRRGPVGYMAGNPVAANLLMLFLLVGGFLAIPSIKQEVFPEVSIDTILVAVPFPGASPSEVEEGVLLVVEEAVQGIDGVKRVTSTASESVGQVMVEVYDGFDSDDVLTNVRSAVDRITTFPVEIEQPRVSLLTNRNQVLSVIVYGDANEATIRAYADQVRDELLSDDGITLVELTAVRPLEISVEIPQSTLRQFNTSLRQVAATVAAGSIDLPAGGIKTVAGEVLLRTVERADFGEEFEEIVVLSHPNGTQVELSDIAQVEDGFSETDLEATFNGLPAAVVEVYRVGGETPITVSEAVHEYLETHDGPPGLQATVWNDRSDLYRGRINLLVGNGKYGLLLVLITLGLFLEIRLAFWVTLGIPISFLGTMLLLPTLDVSLNMISLFAFILTLGIVVDDAIVVGEAVFKHRQDGKGRIDAALAGVKEVAGPVVFSVLTTMVAFLPLLFVPGVMGKFFRVIPIVAITVLALSLVESLLILPAHLGHSQAASRHGIFGLVNRAQKRFDRAYQRVIDIFYVPTLKFALKARYLTIAVAVGTLIITQAVIASGILQFTFMPKIEGDNVRNSLTMPFGTPIEVTRDGLQRMLDGARTAMDELGDYDDHCLGILAFLGRGGSHSASVRVQLVESGLRDFGAMEFSRAWRQHVGEIPGAESMNFRFSLGGGSGLPIDVELSHRDSEVLEVASARLAEMLGGYEGVTDIDPGFSLGKEQLNLTLRPEGRTLGLTATDLARQLRSRFYGSEAARQQRGRDEIRVVVRLPEDERRSEFDIENMLILTPAGGEVPLSVAANIDRGRSYTKIQRRDRRRVLNVTADIDSAVANANDVAAALETVVLPELIADYPGLTYSLEGEQRDQRESLGSLKDGFVFALLGMFALMAIAFRSYSQPIIIMVAIPFGMVGAVVGHLVMGYNLSLISMMGIVALAGITVNDSLILVAAVNGYRKEGYSVFDAVVAGGRRRFRPIMLTSLTTFLGLAPMIFETSLQARFLIPMAVSLGFGVLFATFITLGLVPSIYLVLEDVKRLVGKVVGVFSTLAEPPGQPGPPPPLTDEVAERLGLSGAPYPGQPSAPREGET